MCQFVNPLDCGKCGEWAAYPLKHLTESEIERLREEFTDLFPDLIPSVDEAEKYLMSILSKIRNWEGLTKTMPILYPGRETRKEVRKLDRKLWICRKCYPALQGSRNGPVDFYHPSPDEVRENEFIKKEATLAFKLDPENPDRAARQSIFNSEFTRFRSLELAVRKAIKMAVPHTSFRFTGLKRKLIHNPEAMPEKLKTGIADLLEEMHSSIRRLKEKIKDVNLDEIDLRRSLAAMERSVLEDEVEMKTLSALTKSKDPDQAAKARWKYEAFLEKAKRDFEDLIDLKEEKDQVRFQVERYPKLLEKYGFLLDELKKLVSWDILKDLWNGRYTDPKEVFECAWGPLVPGEPVHEAMDELCDICKKYPFAEMIELPIKLVYGVFAASKVPNEEWEGGFEIGKTKLKKLTFHVCGMCKDEEHRNKVIQDSKSTSVEVTAKGVELQSVVKVRRGEPYRPPEVPVARERFRKIAEHERYVPPGIRFEDIRPRFARMKTMKNRVNLSRFYFS